jgi:hypothetical protein
MHETISERFKNRRFQTPTMPEHLVENFNGISRQMRRCPINQFRAIDYTFDVLVKRHSLEQESALNT